MGDFGPFGVAIEARHPSPGEVEGDGAVALSRQDRLDGRLGKSLPQDVTSGRAVGARSANTGRRGDGTRRQVPSWTVRPEEPFGDK